MNSPNLTRPRAVEPPDDHPEAGVPWHFGDPFAEQRAAAAAVGVGVGVAIGIAWYGRQRRAAAKPTTA